MRTVITLLIFIAAVGLILFLKVTSDKTLITPKYVGVKECKSCHSVQSRGDQYNIWASSRHSKASSTLTEEKAVRYAKQKKIKDPVENPDCLKCHITGFGNNSNLFEKTFNMMDGIQCEECHNPGSEYNKFEIMISKKKFLSKGGDSGNKLHCLKCHSPNLKSNNFNKCPFQTENFSIDLNLNKIKHPLPQK